MASRVLVTAGGSGIGKEIAKAFMATGSTVSVCDIDITALNTTAMELPGLITEACDTSKRQDIERMLAACVQEMGGSDVLVNNAGISGQPPRSP